MKAKIKNIWDNLRVPILEIICSLIVGGVVIALTGKEPFKA